MPSSRTAAASGRERRGAMVGVISICAGALLDRRVTRGRWTIAGFGRPPAGTARPPGRRVLHRRSSSELASVRDQRPRHRSGCCRLAAALEPGVEAALVRLLGVGTPVAVVAVVFVP